MPAKEKESSEKVPALKGAAAEQAVLNYVKEMNRPFGAADIFANLKGAVGKSSVQKILTSLAEKGDITQKTYGKTLIFVANQTGIGEVPAETVEALEAEERALSEENKRLSGEVKELTQQLNQLRNIPTDAEIEFLLRETDETLLVLRKQLGPLRAGQPLITAEEIAHLDADWQKWRTEWIKRKKVFFSLWNIATGEMTSQESLDLADELGIEYDTPEHSAVENGPLCKSFAMNRR